MSQVKVTVWGDGLAVPIPRGVIDLLKIEAGDTLELTPAEKGVLVRKAEAERRYNLADILDSFIPADDCPEMDWGGPKGEEIW